MALPAHVFQVIPTVPAAQASPLTAQLQAQGFPVSQVTVARHYTVVADLGPDQRRALSQQLTHSVTETCLISQPLTSQLAFDWVIEVGFLPGVTDNVAHTVTEGLQRLIDPTSEHAVYSSTAYYLQGDLTPEQIDTIAAQWFNPLIQRAQVRNRADYDTQGGLPVVIPQVQLPPDRPAVVTVDLEVPDSELQTLGKQGILDPAGHRRGPLALSLTQLHAIRDYFRTQGRPPTDIELESIAQTWSEHCQHAIFGSPLDDIEEGIFKRYIVRATTEVRTAKGDDDFCVSVFSDNAGGIKFDDTHVVTDKCETHNSPSALDPFGGAITGIVGVNRDCLGYGLGAQPIANRYGFCVGHPGDTRPLYRDAARTTPALSPKTILQGVVAGVNAGGNESGIPTTQGFVYAHEGYRGKPLVFAGTIGLIPLEQDGINLNFKAAQPGDRIIMAGGKVGLDGIHGATFSSEALDTGSPSTAVQIGDPITQKKLSDTIIYDLRPRGLYSSITDNGAGGLSCSVAEMARECGGCLVDIEKIPTKYPHLRPWEIWISESQERMTFAVPPQNVAEMQALCAARGVEMWDIGEFTADPQCIVRHHGEVIYQLDMHFLHKGNPPLQQQSNPWVRPTPQTVPEPDNLHDTLLSCLAHPSVGSTQWVSEQYDHIVGGRTVIGPLQGPGRVNGTASVLKPKYDSDRGIVLSQGLNPSYSDLDPYAAALASLDDAVAAAVATGANVDHMALMDNFCWCSSTDSQRLHQLHDAARACYDLAVAYGCPYISGKDSMFNDFRGYDADGQETLISIPPTLLGSTLSVIDSIHHVQTLDFKPHPDSTPDTLFLLGTTHAELAGSLYAQLTGVTGTTVPQTHLSTALARYRAVHRAHQQGLLRSIIHLDRGGLGVALSRSAIAGQIGAQVDLAALAATTGLTLAQLLLSESQSRFLVSVAPDQQSDFQSLFPQAIAVGQTTTDHTLTINDQQWSLADLTTAYRSAFSPLA